ncbi:GIN domain-containing protein, partial [Chloroflexota bacterium]
MVLVLVATLLVSGLMTGCVGVRVEGSGTIVTETFDFSDFTNVETRNGIQVELVESSTFKVELIVDDNVLEHINVNKSGDTLRI